MSDLPPPPPPPPQPAVVVRPPPSVNPNQLAQAMGGLKPTTTTVRHFTNLLATQQDSDDEEDEDGNSASSFGQELLWRAEWIATRNTLECRGPPGAGHPTRVAVLLIDGKKQQHHKFERFAYILCGEKYKDEESDMGEGFLVQQIDCGDLKELTKEKFDVLVVPGGSIFEVEEKIGDAGAHCILNYVKSGGGFFGVCAGGFLASRRGYNGCRTKYALLNSETGWVPGVGSAYIHMDDSKQTAEVVGKFVAGKDVKFHFANGACFGEKKKSKESYVGKPGHPSPLGSFIRVKTDQGVQDFDDDSTHPPPYAGCCGEFGKGRVVGFGPHPEASDHVGHAVVRNSILWCAKRR